MVPPLNSNAAERLPLDHNLVAFTPVLHDLDEDLVARGADPALRPLIRSLAPAARNGGPVLLAGESGVGKEFFARRIHSLRWGRTDGFVSVVAAGCSAERLAQLLDGRSSDAGRGRVLSLYIRSVELLGAAQQAWLGAWMRTAARARGRLPLLLAGTQGELASLAARGLFDRSISDRLRALGTLRVPPFRDRREDRLFVAMEVLGRLARESGCPMPGLSPRSWDRILRGPWRGNVRELVNALRQAFVECGPAHVVTICPAKERR